MAKRHKLAKQIIQKYSLNAFQEPYKLLALAAIMEFSELVTNHERKYVRALSRKKK